MKKYWQFIKESQIDNHARDFLLRNGIELNQIKINENGSIDVYGDVVLMYMPIGYDGRLPVKFGTVSGNFTCGGVGLHDLVGCPDKVLGFFSCR